MFGIGIQELLLVGVLSLLVFGPDRLSGMARDAGRFLSHARRSVNDFKSEMGLDGEYIALEDLEADMDEAGWFDREEQKIPEVTPEGARTGNHDRRTPAPDRGLDGDIAEVPLEK